MLLDLINRPLLFKRNSSILPRSIKIEEEREQLAVEIRYLQAKDAEFLKQQDSLVAELKKANERISRKLAELEERSPETLILMPTDLLEVGTRRCQRAMRARILLAQELII